MKRSDKEGAADALDELLKKLALVDEKLDALTEKWANVEASFDEARSGNDGDGKTSTSSEGGGEKPRRNESGGESAESPLEKCEPSGAEEKKGRNRDEAIADEPFNADDANETSFSGPGIGTTLVGVAAGLAAWSILKDERSEKNAASSGGWRERDVWNAEDDWDSEDEDEDDWDSDDGGFDDDWDSEDEDEDDWDSDDEDEDDWDSDDEDEDDWDSEDEDEDNWDSEDEDEDDWDSDNGGFDDVETGDYDWGGGFESGDFDLGGGFDFDIGDIF